MLEKSVYKETFLRDAAVIAAAGRQGLEAPVPSCPGWTMATLVSHLTCIYAGSIVLSRTRAQENIVKSYADLGLPPAYNAWFDAVLDESPEARKQPLPPMPPDLLDLFAHTAATLVDVLWALEPSTSVWTWFASDQTAGFRQRRITQETAVHRWDAQLAFGKPESIDSNVAADGIDEMLDVIIPHRCHWVGSPRQGSGELYHFHRTDGPGEWLVRFDAEGPVVTREHAKGDVALRGAASDLLLWLWHRIPADRMEVFGDAALLDRFFELVPPD